MTEPEFSRPVRLDTPGELPTAMAVAAGPDERAALAARFGLLAIDRLEAELSLSRSGDGIDISGTLRASVVQACVASAAPVPAALIVPFAIAFRPHPEDGRADEELELSESEMDIVFYDGAGIDVGEAVAETLALNLDPWPRSPEAEATLRAAGVKREDEIETEKSPFAALAGLKDKLRP